MNVYHYTQFWCGCQQVKHGRSFLHSGYFTNCVISLAINLVHTFKKLFWLLYIMWDITKLLSTCVTNITFSTCYSHSYSREPALYLGSWLSKTHKRNYVSSFHFQRLLHFNMQRASSLIFGALNSAYSLLFSYWYYMDDLYPYHVCVHEG